MPLAELRSQESRTDARGEAIATEVWYVNLRPEGAALEFLALDKGITDGTPYSGDASMVCDALDCFPEVDGVGTVITAKYSTSGRYLFLRPLGPNIPFVRYTKSWQKVRRLIPIGIRRNFRSEKPGVEPVDAWVPSQYDAGEEKQDIVEVEVAFTQILNQFAVVNAIGAQINKIHKFSSMATLYRFEAGPVQHVGPNDFTCKYSWIGDNGTPVTDTMIDAQAQSDDRLYFPFPVLSGDPIRKPHHEFVVSPSILPPTTLGGVPKISQTTIYDFNDQQGWRTLPGLPSTL